MPCYSSETSGTIVHVIKSTQNGHNIEHNRGEIVAMSKSILWTSLLSDRNANKNAKNSLD